MIPVYRRGDIADSTWQSLAPALAHQSSMKLALEWFTQMQPPLVPSGLVQQDELSFDLLVPFGDSYYLSYSTS